MFKPYINATILVLACLSSGFLYASGTINKNGKALSITQRVGLSSDGYPSNVVARAGTLRTISGVMTITRNSTTIESGVMAGGLAYIPDVGFPGTQSAWLAAANTQLSLSYLSMKPAVTSYMGANGISSAIIDYAQRVLVDAVPAPKIKWLTWRVLIDSTGRDRFSSAKLLDESPQALHVTYIQKTASDGLPASFVLPDAGAIKWRVTDLGGVPITSDANIDVNGVYDEPQYIEGGVVPAGCSIDAADGLVSCDVDFGLKCLINNQSSASCPSGYKDVRQLIDDTAPAFVTIDYARKVEPVYNEVESPAGSGEYVSVAKVGVSVNTRKWTQEAGVVKWLPMVTQHYQDTIIYNEGYDENGEYFQDSHINVISQAAYPWGGGLCHGKKTSRYFRDSDNPGKLWRIIYLGSGKYHYLSPADVVFDAGINAFKKSCLSTDINEGWGCAPLGANPACANPYEDSTTPITYQNTGAVGYLLQAEVSQYHVLPDLSYQSIGQKVLNPVASPQPYDKTVTLPAGSTCSQHSTKIIDPFATVAIYDYLADDNDPVAPLDVNGLPASSYLYVAPIVGCL